jgi:hypothetical protein
LAVLVVGFHAEGELSSPSSSAKRDEEPPVPGSSAKREDLDLRAELAAEGSSGEVPNKDIGETGDAGDKGTDEGES